MSLLMPFCKIYFKQTVQNIFIPNILFCVESMQFKKKFYWTSDAINEVHDLASHKVIENELGNALKQNCVCNYRI